jgi:hypothetical protein
MICAIVAWHAYRYGITAMAKNTAADVAYLIRAIPKPLWIKARNRADQEGRNMRSVLLGLIRAYVAGEAAPKFK